MEQTATEHAPAPYPLRVHQRQALDAVEQAEAAGARRSWVVLPPGAGKTLVGLETARRRGRTTVVLGPNTAIQSQWLRGWEELTDEPGSGTRALDAAVHGADLPVPRHLRPRRRGRRGRRPDELGSLLDRLHPNGRALVERLKEVGDLTLVLDECHHLLEVWGRLLRRCSPSCRTRSCSA